MPVLTLLAIAIAGALLAAGCSDEKEAATTNVTTAAAAPKVHCRNVPLPKTKPNRRRSVPTGSLSGFRTYDLVVKTNCGNFTIRLDQQIPTRAVLSIFRLAESGFYDDTYFHRIVPGFVIQGGDPTGTGFGTAGYTTVDTVPGTARYTKGVVAMAKKQEEKPGIASGQFFIVTADDAKLEPIFVIVGRVVKGMRVVEAIGRRKTLEDEHGDPIPPKHPVVIEKMTPKVTRP